MEARKGTGAARAGKLISLYRECSQHEPYARSLANELPRVKSERFALRIKISRGLHYGAVRAQTREQERKGRARIQRQGRVGDRRVAQGGRGHRGPGRKSERTPPM